jgi:uncharacterized repeat protein (TIGR03803 family)
MHTTKITRTLALAGFAPADKLSHAYCGLLPVLALFAAPLGKLNRGKRAYAVLVLCAATAIALPAQTFTTLFSFDGTDGEGSSALVQATNGDLYGTTLNGGANNDGTVFKITPSGTLTTLYSFCLQSGCPDGGSPFAGLIQGTNGDLYGTTALGGANDTPNCSGYALPGCGTVFKITPSGTLTTLYSFCSQSGCPDGAQPQAGLVQAANGDFYGTTSRGGTSGVFGGEGGTVFKITPSGTLTTLYSFCSQLVKGACADGAAPYAGLVQATNGEFYGTTSQGGVNQAGTVFRITPSGTLTTLHRFCRQEESPCTDGEAPSALFQATDGNFYGTADGGGANNDGTIFKITQSGTLTTLYNFCSQSGCTDGSFPGAALVQDTNGTLYGTTEAGGTSNDGVVFSLSVDLGPFVKTLPTSGRVGELVDILGNDLTGAISVSFNGTPAAITFASPSKITTTVPAGATTGNVQVTTSGRTLSSNVPFRVLP